MDGAIDSDGKRNGSKRNARAPNASAANAAPIPTKPYQRLYQGRLISLESPARRYEWTAQIIATSSAIALPANSPSRSTNMSPSAMIIARAKYAAAPRGRATYSIPAGGDAGMVDTKVAEKMGTMAKQSTHVKAGMEQEKAKSIVKLLKDSKMKVQSGIQGTAVRVSGGKKDDLQAAIALVRKSVSDIPLQFQNFRD